MSHAKCRVHWSERHERIEADFRTNTVDSCSWHGVMERPSERANRSGELKSNRTGVCEVRSILHTAKPFKHARHPLVTAGSQPMP